MAFLGPALVPVISAVGGIAGSVGAALLSKPKTPQPTPTIQRNQAAENAAISDNLAKRTGQRANRRTPYGGAEAVTGGKTSLLGRTG